MVVMVAAVVVAVVVAVVAAVAAVAVVAAVVAATVVTVVVAAMPTAGNRHPPLTPCPLHAMPRHDTTRHDTTRRPLAQVIGTTSPESSLVRACTFNNAGDALLTATQDALRAWTWDGTGHTPVRCTKYVDCAWEKVNEIVATADDKVVAAAHQVCG